jgi:metalloendopeptidase OMA1, mitochondrial
VVVVFAAGYYSCLETVPMTQRTRWIATSPEFEKQLGDDEYAKLLQSFQRQNVVLPPSHRASQTVQRVGSRIAAASQSFLQQYGTYPNSGSSGSETSNSPPGPKYTYTVVRSEQANAFVLPGNHVFVLTGLFQYVWNEDELAAVLGHEIAHNVARHAGEKISQSLLLNMLARLSLLLDPSGLFVSILLPTATLFRELPHSRTQEMEADEIGVMISAMACYDPRAAERVFTRMAQGGGRRDPDAPSGSRLKAMEPPEFLSTHPSHESRIRKFETYMPRALRAYEGDDFSGDRCRAIRRDMEVARRHAAQTAASRGF